MCLVAIAWNTHPRWRLVLAGNRDEFHGRPTAAHVALAAAPARRHGWARHAPGGSWVELGPSGRAAVVTNVRDPMATTSGPSRGHLIANYLAGTQDAHAFATDLAASATDYPPFNLLLADSTHAPLPRQPPHQRPQLDPRRARHVQRRTRCTLAEDPPAHRRTERMDRPDRRRPGPALGGPGGQKPSPPTANCPTPASAWNWSGAYRPPSSAAPNTAPALARSWPSTTKAKAGSTNVDLGRRVCFWVRRDWKPNAPAPPANPQTKSPP